MPLSNVNIYFVDKDTIRILVDKANKEFYSLHLHSLHQDQNTRPLSLHQ